MITKLLAALAAAVFHLTVFIMGLAHETKSYQQKAELG